MKIFYKHTLAFLLLGATVLTASSLIFYFQFEHSLIERTLEQLKSVNTLKKEHIEGMIKKEKSDLTVLLQKVQGDTISISQLKNNFVLKDIRVYNKKTTTFLAQNRPFKITTTELYFVEKLAGETMELELISPINDSLKLIYPISFEKFQDILFQRIGMGTTGESYIVGEDMKMRTHSRFFIDTNPVEIEVKTEGVEKALANKSGSAEILDYRNVPVLSAYNLIELNNIKWAILSEIDTKEALLPLSSMRKRFLFIFFVILFLVIIISIILSKQFIKRILVLKEKVLYLAEGRIPEKPEIGSSQDEIDEIAKAIIQLIDSFEEAIGFARKVGNGNFSSEYKLQSKEDKLGTALVQMRDQLDLLTQEAKRLEKIGREALVEGQELERARLAKDIHDGVGPLLTTIKLRMSSLEGNKEVIDDIKSKMDDTITEVRRISYNLMPSVLLDFGVGAALKNLVDGIKTTTKISFVNDVKSDSRLTERINISVYRIAQETLNNALKYADASQIKISLTEFEDKLSFFISDDGKGFNLEDYHKNKPHSKGLLNVRERVRLLDGELDIYSDMEGTQIEVEIPLNTTTTWKR